MNISVIIPVYKNTSEFITNLKHNLTYLGDIEIIVVNDDPKNSIKDKLDEFPNVILIENKKNLGFAGAVNKGIEKASNDYVMLLNTDVLLYDESYKKALDHFKKNTSLFAVSFAQSERNDEIVGKNILFWKNGFMHHAMAIDSKSGITAWAEGGSCVIDKKKLIDLNGFDELYNPFYWEDIDLSYRAWKRDYQVFFDGTIVVQHHHESTIGSYYERQEVHTIAFRNQLIFIWKNVTDSKLIISHIFSLSFLLLKSAIKGDKKILNGFINALKKFAAIRKKR